MPLDIQRGVQGAREEPPPRRESPAFIIAVISGALAGGIGLWLLSGLFFDGDEARGMVTLIAASLPDSAALLLRSTGISARIGSQWSGRVIVLRAWRVFYTRRKPPGSRYWLPVLAVAIGSVLWIIPSERHHLVDAYQNHSGRTPAPQYP